MLIDLARALLDLHSPQSQDNGLEIGVEAVGRHRDDALCERVVADALLAAERVVFDDRFVVDIFGGNIHQREIVGSFVGNDIFVRDRIHVLLHVARKLASRATLVLFCRPLDYALEILQGELRVHGNEGPSQHDHGIDFLAALEGKLKLKMVRWEDLRQQVSQEKLTQPSAQLWGAQNFLERRNVFTNLVDFAVGLFEPAQALLHVAYHLRRPIESLPQGLLCLVQDFGILFQALIHAVENLPQMLVYQLRAAVQIARKLGASLLDLIEPEGLFFLFPGEQRAQVAKQHPSQYGDGRPGENDKKPYLR